MVLNDISKWQNIYDELMNIEKEFQHRYLKTEPKFYEKTCIELLVELGEFVNETKCFNYWTIKKPNKEKVLELSKKGQVLAKPSDLIKEPYVFEFLGIKEQKPLLEKDLEYKLIKHIEDFLLELGKGFMFVGSQQRITLNNTNYYVDMVFYNKFLKSYVLIDLKMNNLKAENLGQMNLYLNYFEQVVNDENDNKPIGIILCTEKDNVMMEFALNGISNNLFTSTYTYYIPDKEQLINEVEKVLNDNGN